MFSAVAACLFFFFPCLFSFPPSPAFTFTPHPTPPVCPQESGIDLKLLINELTPSAQLKEASVPRAAPDDAQPLPAGAF